ncbi:MAG: RluA family pseudouridine synthase [Oscillospiraceae bacterium]|nr:RluA family pseudouridine synthase [Oscillospiraceae bacterium]
MNRSNLYALPEDEGRRIDLYISERCSELTRSAVQRLCADGAVLADGHPISKSYRLRGTENISLTIPEPIPAGLAAQDIPLNIEYEDSAIIVVNKPRGMVVHPAPGNPDGTLVNALLYHCGAELMGIGGVGRPGIVHRLDKLTSGLLVVAKTAAAHASLSRQIAERGVLRLYEAVVHGTPKEDEGVISAPIGRHPTDRKKMSVQKNGREAVTHYTLIARYRGFSHLSLRLETGRTHQIRVHTAYIGHPVAGDEVYGPQKGVSLGGQCLHARTVGFLHPLTGEPVEFTSGLPEYFASFLKKLT